jgi:hypothetical protein
MGGNTKAIDRETGEVVNFFGRPGFADKIDLKRVDRSLLKKSIIATLKNLDSLYRNEFGVPIWDPSQRNSILSSGEAFNGSSEHLFIVLPSGPIHFLILISVVYVGLLHIS